MYSSLPFQKDKKIVIVSLITDDIFFRLKPICTFLSNKYSQVFIFLFDWWNSRFDYNHIVNEFQKINCKVFVFRTIKEGMNLVNNFSECDFLYLVKHTQINSKILGLWYLFLKSKSKKKYFTRCNIILIRKLLSNKNNVTNLKEFFLTIGLAFKNFLLYLFFYIECVISYYFIFGPLGYLLVKNRQKNNNLKYLKKILFIRMDHLGDIICTLPSLKALKEEFPDSKITFLGASWSCQPLKANPHLYDNLIIWDAPWHDKKNKFRLGFRALIKFLYFLFKIRKQNFDLVIQPRGEGMNVVLSTLIKSKCVISGIDPNRPLAIKMKKFVDIPIILNPYKTYHISEWPKLCLERIGIKIKERYIKGAYKKYDFSEIQHQIHYWKNQGFKVCCLVISAGSKVRLWHHKKFSRLIEELYKRQIISILIGAKNDIRLRKKIKTSVPLVDFVGRTNFQNLETIIRNSDFVISLDTSIMHLASLLGKEVIALFGAGNINLAKPVFNKTYIIKKELGCSGCGDICIFKKRYPCMEMITVNDIFISLTKVLL